MGGTLTLDVFEKLYAVIEDRKANPAEDSYTCYLFGKGADKILKKVAEECGETIIAAKNGAQEETVGEIADLFYHVLVLMSAQGIPLAALADELARRAEKIGNLKTMKQTDRET
ncbi:MAG: phosphoribosyl-ATP diphosphatase [Oscillospiraceae bacterium]|jgi:phosphoribosyl-ATP pyrophosphohydrolase|nr:phosphoribosyl-ATP diphosphatase [Oscillospiraceae bacterium]